MSERIEQDLPEEETVGTPPEQTAQAPGAPHQEDASPQSSPLEEAQAEANKLKDQLLRTLAEYDNFRKRSQRERDSIYPEAEAGIVTKLLPIVDNFERALACECTDATFKKGVEMIFHSLQELFVSLQVEEIGTVGEPFDPLLHNAVMHIEDETLGENVVAEVLQKGYRRGEKILRFAMVKTAN